jgi:hypothetical protein
VDASNLNDAKKALLQEKLAEFERELEKRRLSLLAVTKVTIAILALPGSVWASADIVHKLTSNVLQIVGEAKAVDDENRLLAAPEPMKALLPPRTQIAAPKSHGFGTPSRDLDDEIPF